jgi:hypothetical protein
MSGNGWYSAPTTDVGPWRNKWSPHYRFHNTGAALVISAKLDIMLPDKETCDRFIDNHLAGSTRCPDEE